MKRLVATCCISALIGVGLAQTVPLASALSCIGAHEARLELVDVEPRGVDADGLAAEEAAWADQATFTADGHFFDEGEVFFTTEQIR